MGLCPWLERPCLQNKLSELDTSQKSTGAHANLPATKPLLFLLLEGGGQKQLPTVHSLLPGSQPMRTKSQLTTGCTFCLATPLFFELSA